MKKIPTLNDYPEWREAENLLTSLKSQRDLAEKDLQTALAGINNQRATDRLTAEAESMLAGREMPQAANLMNAMEEALHRRRVAARAVELQEHRLTEIKSRLSREICQQLRPRYSSLVKAVADAALVLDKAMVDERAFRDELSQAGISFSGHLQPVIFHGPGVLSDENSRASHFFREATDAGYLASIN
jgi:hypothetical protein